MLQNVASFNVASHNIDCHNMFVDARECQASQNENVYDVT
jgi:hypothetical protein